MNEQSDLPQFVQKMQSPHRLLFLFLLSAILTFLLPFDQFALNHSFAAQPDTNVPVPQTTTTATWCLAGDFQDWQTDTHTMNDNGRLGDQTAGDHIYALNITISEADQYNWAVFPCDNPEALYPPDLTWVQTTQPNQTVTFSFDTNNYRGFNNDFVPLSFIPHANDNLHNFTIVGDFQDWNNSDPNTHMQPRQDGLYQLIYQVPNADTYETRIVATDTWQSYGVEGRSSKGINFKIKTASDGEYVAFLLNPQTSQVSVRYRLPRWLTWLGYEGGATLVGSLFLLITAVLGYQTMRVHVLSQPNRWARAGCPQCGQHNLQRRHRTSLDRLLSLLGFPIRRYRCANCQWSGPRLRRHKRRKSKA